MRSKIENDFNYSNRHRLPLQELHFVIAGKKKRIKSKVSDIGADRSGATFQILP